MFYVDKHLLDIGVGLGSVSFFLTCVYGDPVTKGRVVVWERLTRIGIQRRENWCLMGDFNDIQHSGEKLGGPRRSDENCVLFCDMLRDCQMVELPSSGNSFTEGEEGLVCGFSVSQT